MKRYIIFGLLDLFFILSFILLFDEIKSDTFWLIGIILIIIFLTVWSILSFKEEI